LELVLAFLAVFLVIADELGGDAFSLGTAELARRAHSPGVCTCNKENTQDWSNSI